MICIKHQRLKKIFMGIFLVFFGCFCLAQNPTAKSAFWNHVRFGGGIGLSFSNGGFSGSLSPSAIYQFNEIFAAGAGVNISFYDFSNESFWAYGPSAIILVNPIPQFQLSGEFEQLRVNSSIQTINGTFENNYWSPALFLGAGYTTNFATVGIRYNVLFDNNDGIYFNAWVPFVRVYF